MTMDRLPEESEKNRTHPQIGDSLSYNLEEDLGLTSFSSPVRRAFRFRGLRMIPGSQNDLEACIFFWNVKEFALHNMNLKYWTSNRGKIFLSGKNRKLWSTFFFDGDFLGDGWSDRGCLRFIFKPHPRATEWKKNHRNRSTLRGVIVRRNCPSGLRNSYQI